MTEQTGAFIWYELMTSDVAAARAFYRAVVGWQIDEQAVPSGGGGAYHMVRRSDGGFAGGVMVMGPEMLAEGWRPSWLGYVHVPDVDRVAGEFAGAGGSVVMGPMDLPGVGRIALARDPQGALIYLMDPTPPSDQPDAQSDVFSVDRPQHMRWNEFNATDLDAALTFYRQRFGWAQEGEMDMGPLGPYRFIQQGGVAIGAFMRKVPEQPEPAWIFYAGVDDIDRAVAAVVANGGTLLVGAMEIPGGEFSATALDPQGAVIGLVGPRKAG